MRNPLPGSTFALEGFGASSAGSVGARTTTAAPPPRRMAGDVDRWQERVPVVDAPEARQPIIERLTGERHPGRVLARAPGRRRPAPAS